MTRILIVTNCLMITHEMKKMMRVYGEILLYKELSENTYPLAEKQLNGPRNIKRGKGKVKKW